MFNFIHAQISEMAEPDFFLELLLRSDFLKVLKIKRNDGWIL